MILNICHICINLTKIVVLDIQYKLALRKLQKIQARLP